MTLRTLALILILASGCATPPDNAPDLLIHAGRVITGTGDTLGETWVAVADGRITEVSDRRPEARADQTLELSPDETLLPGLIETHAHLLSHPDFTKDSDAAMAAFLERTLPEILEGYLEAGFTTVADNGDPWPEIREVRDRIARGEWPGPRILTLGPILTGIDGHPAGNIYGDNVWGRQRGARELDDPDEARRVVDRLVDEGVDGIKVAYDGNPQPRMEPAVLAAILDEARILGVPVFVHAGTAEEALEAVTAGAARLVHVPTESDVRATGLIDLLVSRGIGVATTLGASGQYGHFRVSTGTPDPKYDTTRSNLRQLADAGVLLAYGTDNTNVFGAGRVLEVERRALEDAGLTRAEILRALTAGGARYLFLDDELGAIEPGKRADLLVVRGDPLADLSALGNVVTVFGDGVALVDHRGTRP